MKWWSKLIGFFGGATDPLKTIFDGIDSLSTNDEERGISKNKAIELHLEALRIKLETKKVDVADRSSARTLYGKDAFMQKLFSFVFLVSFFGITWYMLQIYTGDVEVTEIASNFMYAVFGAVSAYMTMIVSFFFGSSAEGNSGKIEKQ